MQPPAAPKIPHSIVIHGETIVDNWFYLRDREHPATIPCLEAENRFTAQVMEPAAALEATLYEEMVGRIQETDSSVPAREGAWEYYVRMEQGKQYAIHCRRGLSRSGLNRSGLTEPAPEQILLDCNALAEGQEYFSLAYDIVSPDGTLLAYAVDTDGSEVYTLRFKDLRTGVTLPDEIPNVYYSGAWTDNANFFYTTLDETKRPYRLWRHQLGSDAPDTLVYEETDARFNASVERTRSGKFLLLTLDSHATSDVRYLPTATPSGTFQPLLPRVQDVEYYAEHQGGCFWIRTDEDAINFRLLRAPDADPANWTEVLPHREDVSIEGLEGFRDHLVVVERANGLKQLRVMNTLEGGASHIVEFEEPAYTLFTEGNEEYDTKTLRFLYTSLVTPRSVYDYDMDSRTRELKKRFAVLGGYDPAGYATERIFGTAPDGVQVPISLVYKRGIERNGTSPLYLYGYGSYGILTEPSFSSDRISLLDRGYVYAIAHIRGSGDLGRQWYEDGKLLLKKNTFTDFIACAEHLIAEKYTAADRLTIAGGSAGGLLMGAVINLRPELFHTAIAHVPFVDVVNTMLDETLPLTIAEYEEWGNPNEREFYDYMRTYAPYENVQAAAYGNVLVTAGLNDPRVSYWEPAKWVAKLRALKTDANVIVLRTTMGAGHGGPSGRYARLKEKAFEYAFLLTR
jgi:oligopeptidase B